MHRQTPRASVWKSSASPRGESYYVSAAGGAFWQRLTVVYSWALVGLAAAFAVAYTLV